jgi:hypothetical protein
MTNKQWAKKWAKIVGAFLALLSAFGGGTWFADLKFTCIEDCVCPEVKCPECGTVCEGENDGS